MKLASFLDSLVLVKRMHRPRTARTLLAWVFCRKNDMVTCQLDQEGTQYRVGLLPHRELRSAVIDTFDAGLTAFQRHAALAAELRRSGWMLVAYR